MINSSLWPQIHWLADKYEGDKVCDENQLRQCDRRIWIYKAVQLDAHNVMFDSEMITADKRMSLTGRTFSQYRTTNVHTRVEFYVWREAKTYSGWSFTSHEGRNHCTWIYLKYSNPFLCYAYTGNVGDSEVFALHNQFNFPLYMSSLYSRRSLLAFILSKSPFTQIYHTNSLVILSTGFVFSPKALVSLSFVHVKFLK